MYSGAFEVTVWKPKWWWGVAPGLTVVLLLSWQTRVFRNLGSLFPARPKSWNTLQVVGFRAEQLQDLSMVWFGDAAGPQRPRVVTFEKGDWKGVPNEYGVQRLIVYRSGAPACALLVTKTSNWYVLDYELTVDPQRPKGCSLRVSGPSRAWIFEQLFGALRPVSGVAVPAAKAEPNEDTP